MPQSQVREPAPVVTAALSHQFVELLLAGDSVGGEEVVTAAIAGGASLHDVYVNILQEALYEVGRRWQCSQLTVAQEHYCTAATQHVMGRLHAQMFRTPKRGFALLATSVGGNMHSVGIRMLADIFELAGWSTTYLGADPELTAIREVFASGARYDVVAISAALEEHVENVAELVALIRQLAGPVRILVGGRPFNADLELWRTVGADGHATTPDAAVALAGKLVADPKPHIALVPDVQAAQPLVSRPTTARSADEKLLAEMSRLNNELHDMTRALASKNAELARLNAQVNRMMGMAAHDLRNPLTVLGSHAQLLIEDLQGTLGAEQQESLDAILESARFMRRLLDDLLDVSRIRAGKLQLDLETVELVAALRTIVKHNATIASRKQIGVTLRSNVDAVAVRADGPKLQQLVNNLVGNAVQYSMPGTEVVVSLEVGAGELLLVVKDSGQGIPAAQVDKIFAPFETTSTLSTGGEKSTGLGLAIVQAIAEAHGGAVRVESTLGVGTTFFVTLPGSIAS